MKKLLGNKSKIKIEQQKTDSKALEKAEKHKQTLLEYDQTCEKRTQV